MEGARTEKCHKTSALHRRVSKEGERRSDCEFRKSDSKLILFSRAPTVADCWILCGLGELSQFSGGYFERSKFMESDHTVWFVLDFFIWLPSTLLTTPWAVVFSLYHPVGG